MIGISIIICCYNSAKRLPETLKHLAKQKVSKTFKWEIILVDNASKDNTKEIALQEWSNYQLDIPFKIIVESRPGLSFARETGTSQAQFSFILFCDDDNWLDENYLHNAFELMARNPTIGCLGGFNEPVSEVPFPYWFKTYEQAYACGAQNEKEGWLKDRFYICGAGMIVRKKALDLMKKIEFTSLLSDRVGTSLSSGGDGELSFIVLMMGYGLYYSPKLKLKHYMPANRLNWDYLVRMNKGHARAGYFLSLYHDVYRNKPLKRSWLHEGSIRLYYFLRENPFKILKRWATVRKREGDIVSMASFKATEELLAHFYNLKYTENLQEIKNLSKRIKSFSEPLISLK